MSVEDPSAAEFMARIKANRKNIDTIIETARDETVARILKGIPQDPSAPQPRASLETRGDADQIREFLYEEVAELFGRVSFAMLGLDPEGKKPA